MCGIKAKSWILIFWLTGRIDDIFHVNGLFAFFVCGIFAVILISKAFMFCPHPSVFNFRRQWLQLGLCSLDKDTYFLPLNAPGALTGELGPWKSKAKILLNRICLNPPSWLCGQASPGLFISVKPWPLCCVGSPSRGLPALASSPWVFWGIWTNETWPV